MVMNKRDPIETAKAALDKHYPNALGAFAGGSVIQGTGTETSDIDIAVLFDDSFDEVHRFSTTLDDWPIEFFVHNLRAQNFYFEQDRLRGMCVMPTLVGTGVMIPETSDVLRQQQSRALEVIKSGPPVLTDDDVGLRRYGISDLLDDLVDSSDSGERNAILVQLHNATGDLYLRGQGAWSGVGKALIRKLEDQDPTYAAQFADAFGSAFQGTALDKVIDLIDLVLQPYGGRLRHGYRSIAPDRWKTFES